MADAKIRITAQDLTKAGIASAKKGLQGLTQVLGAYKGQITALAGAAGIVALIKSQIDLGDQLSKTSQKVGVSVENLSAYQYAAKLSGASNESLTASLSRLAKSMQEAAQDGGGETARFFQSLGVSVTDTNGRLRDTGAVFEDLSRVFAGAPDGPEKTAAAMKLLGRSGAELLPLMNSLKELKAEAQATGNVVSTDFAKKSEEFNDSMERLQSAAGRMARSIATAVIPVLADMAEHLAVITGSQIDYSITRLIKERESWTRALEHAKEEFSQSNDAESLSAIEKAEAMLADLEKRITAAEARKKSVAGTPGGSRLSLPTDRKADDKLLSDAQGIDESLMTEEEKIRASHANRLGILLAAREQELISEATFNENRERLAEEHGFKMIGLTSKAAEETSRLWASGLRGRLSVTQGILGQLSGLMQSSSEKMFKIGKAAALSNAAVSMGESIASAAATKPFFPLGLLMVGKAALLGKATIDGIRSQQFGGGAGAGTFSASSSSGLPSGTDISSSSSNLPPPPQQQQRQRDKIVIYGLDPEKIFTGQQVRDLYDRIIESNDTGVSFA